MPKLNQKYQVTPLRREVVYEATEAVVNLPIEDMHNIAVMDSEDFFNQPVAKNLPKQQPVNKKRKRTDQPNIKPSPTDDVDEDEQANTKRIKLNAFAIPKGQSVSTIQVKQERDIQEDYQNPNSYISRLKQFQAEQAQISERSFCLMKFQFRKYESGIYFYFG